MATNTTRQIDFESQLELGEMLLSLGRIEEAAVELKKAKDLNEIGAVSTSADDPTREEHLERLADALRRVDEMAGTNRRSGRLWLLVGALALLALTGLMFFTWALNREELLSARLESTLQAEIIAAERTTEAQAVKLAVAETTRQAEQIGDMYAENSLLRVMATENAKLVGEAAYSADTAAAAAATSIAQQEAFLTLAAQSIDTPVNDDAAAADSGGVAEDNSADSQPADTDDLGPTSTALPTVSAEDLPDVLDQVRIDTRAANVRGGPGFAYFVTGRLARGEVVTLLAKSRDHYWYNIEMADGDTGWVHSSLAKPLTLDWLPEAATIPAPPPTPRPTSDATATPLPPSPTPTNTPLPTNTPFPTNTPAPATQTPLPAPTDTVDPTATAEPTAESTAQPTAEPTAESGDDGVGERATPTPTPTAESDEDGGSGGAVNDLIATVRPGNP